MRYIAIIALITLFSCKSKEQVEAEKKEKAKQDAQELVNKISAPLIANEVGEMNILIETAGNKNLSISQRQNALGDLFTKYCGYICQVYSVTIDNINSNQEFKDAVKKEKDLITAKWRAEAAKQVYKQSLQKQYETNQ